MKKRIPTFLAGMATMALVGSLAITAFAATGGSVTFNSINLRLDGKQISAKGEDYTIGTGASVPASILYTDENGGGTTYLPIARVSELLGAKIGWDGKTGSVIIGEAVMGTSPSETNPDTASTPPADYSNWTTEQETAYQEFKAMWEASLGSTPVGFVVDLRCHETEDVVDAFLANNTVEFIEKCCYRLDVELYEQYGKSKIMYHFSPRASWGWMDTISPDGWTCGYKDF